MSNETATCDIAARLYTCARPGQGRGGSGPRRRGPRALQRSANPAAHGHQVQLYWDWKSVAHCASESAQPSLFRRGAGGHARGKAVRGEREEEGQWEGEGDGGDGETGRWGVPHQAGSSPQA